MLTCSAIRLKYIEIYNLIIQPLKSHKTGHISLSDLDVIPLLQHIVTMTWSCCQGNFLLLVGNYLLPNGKNLQGYARLCKLLQDLTYNHTVLQTQAVFLQDFLYSCKNFIYITQPARVCYARSCKTGCIYIKKHFPKSAKTSHVGMHFQQKHFPKNQRNKQQCTPEGMHRLPTHYSAMHLPRTYHPYIFPTTPLQ